MRKRNILVALAVLFAAAGLVLPAAAAHAQSGLQFCYQNSSHNVALNAWDSTTQINAWNCDYSDNNFFTVITNQNQTQYSNIEFTGGGFGDGECIGNYGNTSGDERSGLVGGCGGSGIGWGGNWGTQLCDSNNGIEFWNAHSGGWLGPSGLVNGDAFYNNKPGPYCFVFGNI